jgi:DNA repair protein RadC
LSSVDGKLSKLSQLSVEELCAFKVMGKAKAIGLLAALEIGKRQKSQHVSSETMNSSITVFSYIAPRLSSLPHEEFWVIYLNQAHRLLACEQLSRGGIS